MSPVSVSQFVSEARLWTRHMEMARHGATAKGGTNRQALSAEEFAAWRQLIDWSDDLRLSSFTDSAGNLFIRLNGTEETAAPVLTGSHLDSQPTGGKFDGVYGVLAGLEAVQAMLEAGFRPRRSVEVVAWMNEEGSRFAPGMMGSSAFCGAADIETYLHVRDATGHSVADCLALQRSEFPTLPVRPLVRSVSAYIEAHIEQGPILERERIPVGVVTGIQGKRTFRVRVSGQEAHAGTTSLCERKDALINAVSIIHALAGEMHNKDDSVKFTVGRLEVHPNAPSVVAGSAVFSIDLRHPDSEILTSLGDRIPDICLGNKGTCDVEVIELTNAMSLEFPGSIRSLIRDTARELGIQTMEIFSAAGHDARYLHSICSTGMIFVPCKDGISHNELEDAAPEHLAAGARVLTGVVASLANR